MLTHYVVTALRNFLRYPIYSVINVLGLVLGLACALFIFLWVEDELSYDRYHSDKERVFKVMENQQFSDGTISTDQFAPAILSETLKADYPEVEETARMAWTNDRLFRRGDLATFEYGVYADGPVLSILNFPIVEGDPNRLFPDNHSIAISKKMAEKFFPNATAIGNTFRLDNNEDFTVSAVFENRLGNTSERFQFVLPSEIMFKLEHIDVSVWTDEGWLTTYVKLKDKNDAEQLNEKIKGLFRKHNKSINSDLFLFPMSKWHLYSHFENGKQSGGRIYYIISFSAIAVFIMLIACINFMNLSTARASIRSKEVGVRKVTGATQSVLVRQFMTESLILSFAAMVVALAIVHILLPLFNQTTNKQLSINYADPMISGSLLTIVLLTGLLAGSYPAFFLASVRPASVLKSQSSHVFKGASLRKILVVFQFCLSMIVITCTLVINNQISHMRSMDVGFDRKNIIVIDMNPQLTKNFRVFKNNVLREPTVVSASLGNSYPWEINGSLNMTWQGKAPNDDTYFNQVGGDHDYISTMGFTIIKGRDFSRELPTDTANFVVTEQVAQLTGFKDPIGQRLRDGVHQGVIIGVVKDFHNLGVRERLHPTIFTLAKNESDLGEWAMVFIRYKEGKAKETLEHIEKHFKSASDFPMRYHFLDDEFEWSFRTDLMTAYLTRLFTGMALIISCLGLFGLATFSTRRRTKEISIRKIFGATVTRIVVMLCNDFVKLVTYSILIGLPIAFYLMRNYLAGFAYRIDLDFWMFLLPALAMFVLSVTIISVQSIKAALTNPVDVMRDE